MPLKYVIFSYSGEGLPVASRLQDEGQDVLVAEVTDQKDTLTEQEKGKEEKPEEKKRRLSMYDGIVYKQDAWKVVEDLKKVSNPKDYFLFFSLNQCFKFAEALSGLGFNGNFPTEEDRVMEVDRDKAKEFVQKNYKDVQVGEAHEFSKIDEAKKFLESSQDTFVLKGFDEDARTVVPDTDDPDLARSQLEEALDGGKQMYEKSGFILEKKIRGAIELTPEIHFWNGKPLFTTMDIELKRFGAGDNGPMTGCAGDLVFETDMGSDINLMAFPKAVQTLAEAHEGWFIWDASLLFDPQDDKPYFGEFCSNRVGYNAFYSELSLMPQGEVHVFFEELVKGKNPLQKKDEKFASSVRIFNPHKNDAGKVLEDAIIEFTDDTKNDLWLMDAKMDKEGDLTTTGYTWDLAVITGIGNDPKESADHAYMYVDGLSFEGKYFRPEHDYLSKSYKSSIMNRFNFGSKRNLWVVV